MKRPVTRLEDLTPEARALAAWLIRHGKKRADPVLAQAA